MTENRSNGNGVSGEKPVINEFFEDDFSGDSWVPKIPKISVPYRSTVLRSGKKDEPAAEEAKTEEQPDDNPLTEGARLFRRKRWEDALQKLLCVQADSLSAEEQSELSYYLGLCYTKLERFAEAPPHLQQHIGSGADPLRVYQCRMTLAYIYIMTDRAEMAESELERLQTNGLESVMLYNTMAYAAYARKHYLAAIEFYEKALDMDDENTTALNSLGYILADTGLDKIKGLRLCRKAVERNSQNAAYLDSLGWACYKCGKPAEARDWLVKAKDMAPEEKEIQSHYKVVVREVP